MLDTPQCGSKQRKVSGAPNKRHNAQPLTRLAALGAVFLLVGCESAQSAFSPFGEEAASTLRITWAMIIAAALITVGVLGLAWHAAHAREGSLDLRGGMRVILWLGAIAPTLILAAMLVYSLPSMRTLQGAPGDMRIAVNG